MPNVNRRKVLKGISVTGAAAMAPLSLKAAKLASLEQPIAMYINAAHGRYKNSTSNQIINTSHQAISLDTRVPVGYKSTSSQNFALYANSPEDRLTLQPGERLEVYARRAKSLPDNAVAIENKVLDDAMLNV